MPEKSIRLQLKEEFSLLHTYECGQAFRWKKQVDGSYSGVVEEMLANISLHDDELEVRGAGVQTNKDFWIEYLDLKRDYGKLMQDFSVLDCHMKSAIEFSRGMHLLKQPFFEVLISFIISQNNNVPRISGLIERISKECGTEVGDELFAFPTPEQLNRLKEADFARLGAGYRAAYLEKITQLYMDGKVNAKELEAAGFHHARNELIALPGIGPKVADCVLLFSGIHYEAFPSDVWVKRIMQECYGVGDSTGIYHFAQDYFGKYAGIAQQYLFHYVRKNWAK